MSAGDSTILLPEVPRHLSRHLGQVHVCVESLEGTSLAPPAIIGTVFPLTTVETTPLYGHGGWRVNAGRKKTNKRVGGPHRARPEIAVATPLLVTQRVACFVPELRLRTGYDAIRSAMVSVSGRPGFRIVHTSIQNTHLHYIVEADSKIDLTRGMQSLTMRISHELKSVYPIGGKVSPQRYHANVIVDARYARNALAYVLNNWRRHGADCVQGRLLNAALDIYSTAGSFEGWRGQPRLGNPPGYIPLPATVPVSQLLTVGWKQFGLIDPFQRPGPMR